MGVEFSKETAVGGKVAPEPTCFDMIDEKMMENWLMMFDGWMVDDWLVDDRQLKDGWWTDSWSGTDI